MQRVNYDILKMSFRSIHYFVLVFTETFCTYQIGMLRILSYYFKAGRNQMSCLQSKKEVQFAPEQWLQGMGEVCMSCKQRLETEDCISLCKCYLFTHEQCFLRQFSPHIFDNQKLICMRCQEEVIFEYQYISKWQCNKKPVYIGSLVFVGLLLLALLIIVATGTFRSVLSDGAGYAIFAIGLAMLVLTTVFSMRKKYIDIDRLRIKNTNLLNIPETDAALKSVDYQNDLKKCTTTDKAMQFDIQ